MAHADAVQEYTFAESAAMPGAFASASTASKNLNVLLVEDDDADAYLIELALSDNPRIAGIIRACDGIEALEIVDGRNMRPDLAIVDLHMPRKDGFTLLAELGARVTVEFPSVVLTSSRASADARKANERGCAMFLTKPDGLAAFKDTLNRVVDTV